MKKVLGITIFTALVIVVFATINIVSNTLKVNSNDSNEIDFSDVDSITKIDVPPYVKRYDWTKDGEMDISEVFIPVETVMQLPELPHGCEITALTSILNTYEFNVSKTEMADKYLPKQPFTYKNSKRYGANPYKAYAGNPRSETGGFFTYAPPIVEAADKYLADIKADARPVDISGSTREEIISLLDQGIPVAVWVTLDLSKPKLNYSWYIHESGEQFQAPVNLHTVVLNGYDEKNVHAMNPLKGQMTYDANTFFKSYEELGSHAMIVVNNEK